METITVTKYKCTICGEVYDEARLALECEELYLQDLNPVKVGDTVLITWGEGTGRLAVVESTSVLSREWGHYAWRRYWHTVSIVAKIIDSWGSRMLTFDQYEVHKRC